MDHRYYQPYQHYQQYQPYQAYLGEQEQSSLSDDNSGKSMAHKHSKRPSNEDLQDARRSKAIRSTLKLKLNVLLASTFSLGLMCLAALQSYKQFITLGYAPLVPDNSRTSIINAAVAVYGAITGMATRHAVTKCLNLISIKALTTGGKFIWSAKTWAYMSHANGPWYTMGPLFVAGLAATAVISILPAAVVDPGHYVHLQIVPDLVTREVQCSAYDLIVPTVLCTGSSIAATLLQSYSVDYSGYASNHFGSNPELILDGQVSSNRSFGYPWELVNNNLADITKYNISNSQSLQLTNKTACTWVLDRNPMRCSFVKYAAKRSEVEVISPFTDEVYIFNSTSSQPQAIETRSVANGTIEMAVVGTYYPDNADAFVCTTKELSKVHVGRYITAEPGAAVTHVDITNDTSCQPTYGLPSDKVMFNLVNDIAGGIYEFTSVNGHNVLVESFPSGSFNWHKPLFTDSENELEDGMGAFMALMLSHIYSSGWFDSPNTPNSVRVEGGFMVTTVGLGEKNRLYAWLIVSTVPLLALITAIGMPLDYMPSWDIMNPMDALATEAIMDESIAAANGRSSGIRLGIVDGRVVASNTNLPTRISRENMV